MSFRLKSVGENVAPDACDLVRRAHLETQITAELLRNGMTATPQLREDACASNVFFVRHSSAEQLKVAAFKLPSDVRLEEDDGGTLFVQDWPPTKERDCAFGWWMGGLMFACAIGLTFLFT